MYLPESLWTWSFFLVAIIQACAALGLEVYVFARFEMALAPGAGEAGPVTRTTPCYLSLLIFAFLYQLLLVYDALHKKNTIQVIGICAYNVAILIYTAIQVDQIKDAIGTLSGGNHIRPDSGNLWTQVHAYLIAVPCVIGLGTALLLFISWKLNKEFAWTIYKKISADLRLKRRYLVYQIYIALLKFDFFLFLGFEVQFLVIVANTNDSEFIITCVSVLIIFCLLILAAYSTRKENIYGMIFSILLYLAALAYFVYKVVRMYANTPRRTDYYPARKTLTVFAVITIILLLITIYVAIWCTLNFGKGLKPHVERNADFFGHKRRQTIDDEAWGYDSYGGGEHPRPKPDNGMYMDRMTAQRVDYAPGTGGGAGGGAGGSRMTID